MHTADHTADLYPIPEPIEFKGDKAFALSLLKQVTLADDRYICFEVEELAKQHPGRNAYDLLNWIQDHMGDWYSYEGWLTRVHGVPSEETERRNLSEPTAQTQSLKTCLGCPNDHLPGELTCLNTESLG